MSSRVQTFDIAFQEWFSRQSTCPIDRQPVTMAQLKPAPRILRNLLSRLTIICDNAQFGCTLKVRLESLASHQLECEFNPKRPVQCDKGCELFIPKDELQVYLFRLLCSLVYNLKGLFIHFCFSRFLFKISRITTASKIYAFL